MGRLPDEYQKQLKLQIDNELVRFMIYSFGTPIAWVLHAGTWIVPEVKYTNTTTQHQGFVKVAIENYDFWNKLADRSC